LRGNGYPFDILAVIFEPPDGTSHLVSLDRSVVIEVPIRRRHSVVRRQGAAFTRRTREPPTCCSGTTVSTGTRIFGG
jgi:hypothetical protein